MIDPDISEKQAAVAEALHRAYPIGGDYVTQFQLTSALQHIETKISASELKQRNWVLGGCLFIIMAFGSGYMSLVSKLDRLVDAMPQINETLDARRSWMLRKDQQDVQQDIAIKSVAPRYIPSPYVEPPK
jgi:hypothetical protein